MNQAIANILKSHIEDLDFVDKIAGLVQTVYMNVTNDAGVKIQKSYPVACCVTADDCKEGAYNDLAPDSKYKTVIYFEDRGVTFEKYEGAWKFYNSSLRLVCWINVAKILGDDCSVESACTLSSHLIADIIRHLPRFPENHAPFGYVYSEVMSQDIHSNAIFSAYTYNELQTQYLMYPYDYFALNINTQFAICMENEEVYNAGCLELTDDSGDEITDDSGNEIIDI